jgi:hypothetical protein
MLGTNESTRVIKFSLILVYISAKHINCSYNYLQRSISAFKNWHYSVQNFSKTLVGDELNLSRFLDQALVINRVFDHIGGKQQSATILQWVLG